MAINDRGLVMLPLFSELGDHQRRALAQVLTERAIEPNGDVFKQGEPGRSCAFVTFGEVIVVGDAGPDEAPRPLATLGVGELIGEMALLDGGPRSAGCVAGPKGAVLAELSRPDFDLLVESGNHFACSLLDLISGQLARRLHLAVEVMRDAALDEDFDDP